MSKVFTNFEVGVSLIRGYRNIGILANKINLNAEDEVRLLDQVPYAKTRYCGLDQDPWTVASIKFEGMGSDYSKRIYTSTAQTLWE